MARFGMKNVLFVLAISVCLFADQGSARPSESGDADGADDYDYLDDEKDNAQGGEYQDPDTDTDSGEGKGGDDTRIADDPPVMHSKPLNLTAKQGDTVYLPCNVDNFEPFVLIWQGKEYLFTDKIKHTDDSRFHKFENNTIQIKNVRYSDSGNYSCQVSGDPPVSVTHELHVPTPPVIIELLPLPDYDNVKKMRKGDTLVLECKVSGYPKPEIKWTRKAGGTGQMKQIKHLRQDKDSVTGSPFTLDSVNRHDDGTYTCSASNGIGEEVHKEIDIHVQYAPEVSIEKETVNSDLGLQSELICTVHASPKAVVEWYHNGVLLTSSTHATLNTLRAKHTLTIPSTTRNDFGTYMCKAVNPLGTNTGEAKLSGLPNPPLLISSMKDNNGISQIFEWTVESSSPISEYKIEYRKTEGKTEWMSAESPIVENPEGNKYTVKQTLSLPPNKYEVILRAMNTYGWSEPSKRHTFSTGVKNEAEAPNMTGPQTGTAEPSSSAAEDIRPRIFALMTILCATAFFL